jgi:hypothetical protein
MTATLLQRARRATSLGGFARPRAAVAATGLVLVVVAAAIAGAVAFERAYDGRVLPGVAVNGVDLSGTSPAEARDRLAALQIGPAGLVLLVGTRTETVPAEVLGRRIAIDAAVDAAMATGRGRGFFGDIGERLALVRDGRSLSLDATIDQPTLAAWIAAAAGEVYREPVDAKIIPAGGRWEMTMAVRGAALDEPAATALIRSALLGAGGGTPQIVLPVGSTDPDVEDADVASAIQAATRMVADVKLTLEDKSWTIPSKNLRPAIVFISSRGRPVPVMYGSPIEAAVGKLTSKVKITARQTIILKT